MFNLKELIRFVVFFIMLTLLSYYFVETPLYKATIGSLIVGVGIFIFDCIKYYKSNKK